MGGIRADFNSCLFVSYSFEFKNEQVLKNKGMSRWGDLMIDASVGKILCGNNKRIKDAAISSLRWFNNRCVRWQYPVWDYLMVDATVGQYLVWYNLIIRCIHWAISALRWFNNRCIRWAISGLGWFNKRCTCWAISGRRWFNKRCVFWTISGLKMI